MELSAIRSLDTNELVSINLSQGLYLISFVDLSSSRYLSELQQIISHKSIDQLIIITFEDDVDLKLWAKNQKENISCFYSEDIRIKSKFSVTSLPWFILLRNSEIFYSSSRIPNDFTGLVTNSNIPKVKQADIMTSFVYSPLNRPCTEGQLRKKSSQHETEAKLSKALEEIEKMKIKLKSQEKAIEGYKAEVRHMEELLKKNSNHSIIKNEVGPISEKPFDNSKKSLSKPEINKQNISNLMKLEDHEFWKTDELEEVGSMRLDDIASSNDFWLMGLLKKPFPKYPKSIKVLPPLRNNPKASAKLPNPPPKPQSLIHKPHNPKNRP